MLTLLSLSRNCLRVFVKNTAANLVILGLSGDKFDERQIIGNFAIFKMCFDDFWWHFDRMVTFKYFEILLSLSHFISLNCDCRSVLLVDF